MASLFLLKPLYQGGEINMRKILTVLITIGVLTSGCQSGNGAKEKTESSQLMPISNTYETFSQLPSKQAEEILQKKNHLKDIKAVNDDKKLLIAAQIPHNGRFQIKDIEKDLKKQAKKQFPSHKVTLSLDQKINLESK
ncbi:hypothetical protein [Thalassobacillus devorans]|uniref:hypothetical protein n=1 Tax=Thalassobacillus devorans TaxID=279813 RepID=UPI000A1CDB63|nr:hypothetical protein [Thalassobacillus devorans]